VAALKVENTGPILIFGELDRVEGEVWLTNTSGVEVTINQASLTVDFPTPETGSIPLPDNTVVPPGATRCLAIRSGMPSFTLGGTYSAEIAVVTSAGPQVVKATVVIANTYLARLAPSILTFTGVKKGASLKGTVLVVNQGNTPIKVGPIPGETMLEVVTIPRVVEISGATLSVQPGPGLASGGTVTFTNPTKTVAVGAWASIDVTLKMPATLPANRHFRVLPRIVTQRLVVDLLT
jgi:subtilisin family serine protease